MDLAVGDRKLLSLALAGRDGGSGHCADVAHWWAMRRVRVLGKELGGHLVHCGLHLGRSLASVRRRWWSGEREEGTDIAQTVESESVVAHGMLICCLVLESHAFSHSYANRPFLAHFFGFFCQSIFLCPSSDPHSPYILKPYNSVRCRLPSLPAARPQPGRLPYQPGSTRKARLTSRTTVHRESVHMHRVCDS